MQKETVQALGQSNEIDPEHIPNWMRAFYDDFTPEVPHHEMLEDHHIVDPMHSTQAYISAGLHSPVPTDEDLYNQFLRQHHSASVEPLHAGFAYGEPSVTPVSNKKEGQSEEFRQELNRRQYEHSLPYFGSDM